LRQALLQRHTHRLGVLEAMSGILLHRLNDHLFDRADGTIPGLDSA
jgi:hypothetical protein